MNKWVLAFTLFVRTPPVVCNGRPATPPLFNQRRCAQIIKFRLSCTSPFSSPEPLGLICNRPVDVRNFLTSGNGCFQSLSFPYHVTKKRRALGTRMMCSTLLWQFMPSSGSVLSSSRLSISSYINGSPKHAPFLCDARFHGSLLPRFCNGSSLLPFWQKCVPEVYLFLSSAWCFKISYTLEELLLTDLSLRTDFWNQGFFCASVCKRVFFPCNRGAIWGFAKSRPAAQRPAAHGPRPATAQRPEGPAARGPRPATAPRLGGPAVLWPGGPALIFHSFSVQW